jgi:hypothetical protein
MMLCRSNISDLDGRTIGSIESAGGFVAFGVAGKRLGEFATALEAANAIWDAWRRSPSLSRDDADRDTDAELIAGVERFMGVEK